MKEKRMNPMEMEFAGRTAKDVYEAKKAGMRYLMNAPIFSEKAKWKAEQMEVVKGIIEKLGEAKLLPEETIFIFTGKKTHPIEMSECILGEEEGVVFHAVAVHSARIREIFDVFEVEWLTEKEIQEVMEKLFIAKVLLHEIGHFVHRDGNGMMDLSSEEDAESYSWQNLEAYLSQINNNTQAKKKLLDYFYAVHQMLIQDYWLYLDEKKQKTMKAEINRLKLRIKEMEEAEIKRLTEQQEGLKKALRILGIEDEGIGKVTKMIKEMKA